MEEKCQISLGNIHAKSYKNLKACLDDFDSEGVE